MIIRNYKTALAFCLTALTLFAQSPGQTSSGPGFLYKELLSLGKTIDYNVTVFLKDGTVLSGLNQFLINDYYDTNKVLTNPRLIINRKRRSGIK